MSGYPGSLCKGGVKHFFVAVVLIGLISACAHAPSAVSPPIEKVEIGQTLPGERLCRNEESLLNLLELLDNFNRTDAKGRTAIYEEVSTAAVLEPTTANRLAVAMLKAVPGHHGYNLESAQTLLTTVLADSNTLSTGVSRFAEVYARSVAEQRKLAQRNRQLKAELTEAQGKLEALTEIEREVDLPVPEADEADINYQPPSESGLESNSKRAINGEPQKNSASR